MIDVIENHWSHGPHKQFSNSIIFITWRLAFTLPKHVLELFEQIKNDKQSNAINSEEDRLKQQNEYLYNRFQEYDLALGSLKTPGFSLNEPAVESIIRSAFHYLDGEKYDLHLYCIMANHIHVVLQPIMIDDESYFKISNIVQSLKRYTSNQINKMLNKSGQVWDQFYFDRIIRDGVDYQNVVNYVLNNPVEVGLVDEYSKWSGNYYNPNVVIR
jgi:REP element-mobilizing transposase RayT